MVVRASPTIEEGGCHPEKQDQARSPRPSSWSCRRVPAEKEEYESEAKRAQVTSWKEFY